MDTLEQLFEGTELSEETKTSISTLVDAKVKEISDTKVAEAVAEQEEKMAKINEEKDALVEEVVQSKIVEMTAKIGEFMDYVVVEWAKENEVEIESGTKVAIAEELSGGIRKVLQENNIETSEEDSTMITKLEEEVSGLKSKLNESISKNAETYRKFTELQKENIVSDVCEGLTDTEVEKMFSLTEEIEYKDEESFKAKVETIRGSYFPKESKRSVDEDVAIVEENGSTNKKHSALVESVLRSL